MDLHISRLTDLVAVETGEYPDPGAIGWTTRNGCSLRDMIEIIIESLAREVIMQLPLSACTFLCDMRDHIHNFTDWGEDPPYRCEMPGDFLRLHSLRMTDWPMALSDEYRGDNVRLALGDSAPSWLTRRSSRPMIEIIPGPDGVPPVLRFGITGSSVATDATYVPDIRYDSEEGMLRNFQPLAIGILVEKIAAHLKSENK